MSSVGYLREFISERLTAAAEEIFRVFEVTVVEYEEEISRQRKLLDIVCKPEVKLDKIELQRDHVCTEDEEDLADQQLSDKERSSSLVHEESEPLQITHIKEEQEELCTSQEGETLVVKVEADTFMLTPTHEESDHSDPDLKSDHQDLPNNFHPAQSHHHKGGMYGDSGSTSQSSNSIVPEIHSNNSQVAKMSHKCGTCGKIFQYKSKLQRHMNVHTGEKPFVCEFCEQRFGYMSALKTHIRIHTGEKPYSCKVCGKDFALSTALTVHMRTHTGEKPYHCKICGKSFRTMPPLKRHLRVHTGEKPFSCKTCGKQFCRASELKPHLRIHTGEKPYSCEICGKDFRLNSVLKVHMRTHTGEKPYLCKMCGSDFRCSSGLLVHIRRAHSGEKHGATTTMGKEFGLVGYKGDTLTDK